MQDYLVKNQKTPIVTMFSFFLCMDTLLPLLDQALAPLAIDQKWYPVIIVGIVFFVLIFIYVFFAFIRVFLAWLFRIDDLIEEQKNTELMLESVLQAMDILIEQQETLLTALKKTSTNIETQDTVSETQLPLEDENEELHETTGQFIQNPHTKKHTETPPKTQKQAPKNKKFKK